MEITEALNRVLGKSLAQSIIDDKGVPWAVVAATSKPRFQDHEAEERIRAWLRERKKELQLSRLSRCTQEVVAPGWISEKPR